MIQIVAFIVIAKEQPEPTCSTAAVCWLQPNAEVYASAKKALN